MGATRWTARYTLRWSPIITFARRRLELLDWFEANAAPIAFTEDADHVGVAIGSLRSRLVVGRSHASLELRSPDATTAVVRDALSGVFDVLEPKGVRLGVSRGGWTVRVGHEYDEACAALARRAAGLEASPELTFTDCAVLTDFESPTLAGQIEYGVVTGPELRDRLTEVSYGQMAASQHAAEHRPVLWEEGQHALPRTCLFVDYWGTPTGAVVVDGPDAALRAIDETEDTVSRMLGVLDTIV